MNKDFDIIWLDTGYAENKEIFKEIKDEWKRRDKNAKVKRVKTDTKGLIMYVVEKEC